MTSFFFIYLLGEERIPPELPPRLGADRVLGVLVGVDRVLEGADRVLEGVLLGAVRVLLGEVLGVDLFLELL